MEQVQSRPTFVDLTDRIERCRHGWPVEGSECPLCIRPIAEVIEGLFGAFKEPKVFPASIVEEVCWCEGMLDVHYGQMVERCPRCQGVKPVDKEP